MTLGNVNAMALARCWMRPGMVENISAMPTIRVARPRKPKGKVQRGYVLITDRSLRMALPDPAASRVARSNA